MKESLFNISEQYGDNTRWVYNTLTTAVVILDNEKYNRFFCQQIYDNDDHDFVDLSEMGFFIDDNFDELSYLKELRDTVVLSNSKIADIMLAPTMDCNARCYYCFEHGCHHDKMTLETADAVIKSLSTT